MRTNWGAKDPVANAAHQADMQTRQAKAKREDRGYVVRAVAKLRRSI